MEIVEFLSHLRSLDVQLHVEGDQLRVNAPKGVLASSLRQELSQRKSEILKFLKESDLLQLPAISRVSRDERFPLSFAQERLWFLSQLEPDSTAYSMPGTIRLRGRLDQKALEQAFFELARRHETLRSTFRLVDGSPEQVIASEPNLLFDQVDLQRISASEREAEAARLVEAQSRKPFDLVSGPLFRVSVYQLDDEDHLMHINMHHIISDHWSFGVIIREFAELYKSFAKATPLKLPELPVQYADFAHCQRQWLQGEVLSTYLTYWKDKFGGELATLDLPTDRPRPAVQSHRGAEQSLVLPQSLIEALRDLNRRQGVSLFMVLLAAFKVLLFRYTGQEDILVGTPIAGRNRVELEGLIGFFINTIVMRTDLSGTPGFLELVGRVRETALDAYAHQEMPFEKLVEELAPKRDLSRTPLFQVFFNHIRVNERQMKMPGLDAEVARGIERQAKFDITLYVLEQDDAIRLTALYNADLFNAERITTMLDQYQDLLKQAAENPEEKITDYSLLTASHAQHLPEPTEPLTSQWAGAVHSRFATHALDTPEHLAVVDAQGSWRYAELEHCSNQLANQLRDNDIHPGDIVAVYGHRSAGLVLALLGVLKAGAAFLILDPRYPAARLVKMLQEASPRGWLQMEAAGPVAEKLGAFVDTFGFRSRLQIPRTKEGVKDLLQVWSSAPPEDRVSPDDTAYIIFTSGTTGQPKGIVGTHRPLAHFLQWHCQEFSLTTSDRFSMLSGLSHDPLLRDIFTPLWQGATLCIPDPEELLIPDKLRSWMQDRQITVAHMTPALGQLLTEAAGDTASSEETLPALRHIIFGGDVLTWQHVEKIGKIAPAVTCVNFYGATETPQAMGYHVVDVGEKDQMGARIPLGKGIEGVQLLVLNAAGRLAGVGEVGEIHVRTPYLAKGYLNDQARTDERFIVNPFTDVSNDRLYKTGDLGRYLPDGRVIFYGRADSQVSIRGFRVELKEIEATLAQYEPVQEIAVITQQNSADDQRLVAYFVSDQVPVPGTHDFRDYLMQKLPDYMIPSAFISLDELPLTPNGKVDLVKLVTFEHFQTENAQIPPEPLTDMENVLIDIWKEALGLEYISVHDNFFEIGGHSLLVIKVITQAEKKIGVRMNPREFFYQTLGQLAASLEQQELSPSYPKASGLMRGLFRNIASKFSNAR